MCDNFAHNQGRGSTQQGLGYGRGDFPYGNRPTCQIYGKHGHIGIDCWHCFDERFAPTLAQTKPQYFAYMSLYKLKASTSDP